MQLATDREPRSLLPLAIVIVALFALTLVVPIAAPVTAPCLVLVGIRVIRTDRRSDARTLGWLALVMGILLIGLSAFAVLGLMAVGGGSGIDAGQVVPDVPVVIP